MRRALVVSTSLFAATVLASAALAQSPPGAGPRQEFGPDGFRAHMEARREARARDLRAVLNLRADQEGAFSVFEAAMTPPPSDRSAHEAERAAWETMTTPERLDAMTRRMDRRAQEMHRKAEAAKAFYAALSPQQQKVFDAVERLGRGGGRGRREAHGGWARG